MCDKLSQNIRYIKGVGEKRAELFEKLGVFSVGTLVSLYPRNYESWEDPVSVADAVLGEVNCVKARIVKEPTEQKIRKNMTVYKCIATDGLCDLYITFFNNRFVKNALKEGQEFLFLGKVTGGLIRKEMSAPAYKSVNKTAPLRPIYPQTAGLNSNAIHTVIQNALLSLQGEDIETLTPKIMNDYSLVGKYEALNLIHNPKNMQDVERARKRLIFEELLVLQLGMRLMGSERIKNGQVINDKSNDFIKNLPFTPTNAQSRVIKECADDMMSGYTMNRLVEGDVGSGKTAVAAAVCYSVIKNGYQAAMMAPTEVLARQHYKSFCDFYEGTGINVGILTGSMTPSQKRNEYEKLKSGETQMIVGTHALISENVEYKDLALVVTDEQHRFGVKQRARLSRKGTSPHMLVMSATPIPRTLSLIIYGDMQLSVLDEMPKGRRPVMTYSVTGDYRTRIWAFLKKHMDSGSQAYIVCPLVEDSEDAQLVSAEKQAKDLAEYEFGDYSVGLLHGKMKASQKDEIMRRFKDGEIKLLVSTTVIEVGVDVPNATVMVIENAERFGLSQLHQLRGRVGRGQKESYCILISDSKSDTSKARLKIMTETTNGFKIADEDLRLRGPGDFFGDRQHGLPQLKIADMTEDATVLKITGELASQILNVDPTLSSERLTKLRKAVQDLFGTDNFTCLG